MPPPAADAEHRATATSKTVAIKLSQQLEGNVR